jgi:ABC-type dipeptide/oligopeptide/nickel transport system permease subunit
VLGGWVDQLLSRAVDVLMAIPCSFALVLLSILGSGSST